MDLEQIEQRVDKVAEEAPDDEVAHMLEDALYHDFVQAIRDDESLPDELREKARLVLSTEEIVFSRWYA